MTQKATHTMSKTDFGALYVDDVVLLPTDIEATVLGFDFDDNPDARPDNCVVITDQGKLWGRLSTPIERIVRKPSPLPNWVETERWFSSADDMIETLSNTGALA